ncbi:hypothetical protein NM688_g6188 [Phlebia brevispora]|uniref:Uncharacterized protein n=1 Tax=Phlebia brevispora TaxID=194682 RepID=A0ACC1SJ64_9APHY|nr:hypothetical protein NM688_g6188 [Phlebia brevispora]
MDDPADQLVSSALHSMDVKLVDRIIGFRGDDAQRVLDYMQKVVMKLETTAPYRARMQENDMSTYRSRMRILMTRLALASGRLPEELFLHAVQCNSFDPVGQGSFSDIFKGQYQGSPVAIKRLRFVNMINDMRAALFRESLLWLNLEHRHVLPFLGIESSVFKNHFCMVLPWVVHGNINKFIEGLRETGYPKSVLNIQVDKWFEQIAYGLAYLHSEEIVHGDLRGANVLVTEKWEVKLADFGLSILAEGGGNSSSLRGGGSRWLAPELIAPEHYGLTTTRPTYASDIYSLACVSIELYTGKPPFFGMSEAQTILSVTSGVRSERPQFFDGNLMRTPMWTLITDCWKGNPSERPNAETVVNRLMLETPHMTNVVPGPIMRANTTGQCQLPSCPKASVERLGTGRYCSSFHESNSLGLRRIGCLNCRKRLVADDDLCTKCRNEIQDDTPKLVQVPEHHILFDSITNHFRDTWGRSVKLCPSVKSVYKIIPQKAVLNKYAAYRASVEERGHFVKFGKRPGNETVGWHGTRRGCQLGNNEQTTFCTFTTCSLCGIIRTSFDVAYGASGLGFGLGWEILGKGIYTSSSSSKSDKYSFNENWSTPFKAMLLNKVVMGRCYIADKTEGTLQGPPPGYDSTRLPQAATVDDIAVYRNDAIRPSFLVVYESETRS